MPRDFRILVKVKNSGEVLIDVDPVFLVLKSLYVGEFGLRGRSLDDLELSIDGEIMQFPGDSND